MCLQEVKNYHVSVASENAALLSLTPTWGGHGCLSRRGHGTEGLDHLRYCGQCLSGQLGGSLLQLAAWNAVERLARLENTF